MSDLIIQSLVEKDPETGDPLFWSNEFGWAGAEDATVFNGHEIMRNPKPVYDLKLPAGKCKWVYAPGTEPNFVDP